MGRTAPGRLKIEYYFAESAVSSPAMDVEQYAWATEELIRNAEESALEVEEEFRRAGTLTLAFIPLADYDERGFYRIPPSMPRLVVRKRVWEWHYHNFSDAAFVSFEEESRNAASDRHAYLVRLFAYVLAHGMDVARLSGENSGYSILHPVPHSELHADSGEYET